MAERRMFAKTIVGSARFLRMPATARLLYYDLGMEADDDGCVEAFAVMRKTGAAEDDLRVLASREFIRILNDDLVTYISDWSRNNQIRKDRYHEGLYKELLYPECTVEVACLDCVEPEKEPLTNAQQKRLDAKKESSLPYSFEYKVRQAFVGEKCPVCGCVMNYESNLTKPTIQHNVPISLGGKHELDNISVICQSCNCSIRNQKVTPPYNTNKVKDIWGRIGNGAGMATEVSIGKSSLAKSSVDQDSQGKGCGENPVSNQETKPDTPPLELGMYGNVVLTPSDYERLKKVFPGTDRAIERLSQQLFNGKVSSDAAHVDLLREYLTKMICRGGER